MLLRAWRALQVRGTISTSIKFPYTEAIAPFIGRAAFTRMVVTAADKSRHIFKDLDQLRSQTPVVQTRDDSRSGQSSDKSESRGSKSVHQSSGNSESRGGSPSSQCVHKLKARARQRREALASAYSLVPMADKLKVMELLREEFELFGYEARPDDVFFPKHSSNPYIFDLSYV